MTFAAVSIAVGDQAELGDAFERAQAAVDAGARLIEWRGDALAALARAAEALGRLVAESPAPCSVTIRPAWEGGEYDGDDGTRAELFESLLAADGPPRYIDIELAAWTRDAALRRIVEHAREHQRADIQTSLILSSHDFTGRPADLLQRIEQMTDEPACDVVKIAWMARSLRDNLEAFELLRARQKPTIALCMGRFGLLSRVLAKKCGALLTFVADANDAITAPGQPTLDDLLNLYRFESITKHTEVYGVIGWPVEHSQSPAFHNDAFGRLERDAVYLPLPIPPEYEHFKATMWALRSDAELNFRGASVTIPHKEHLVRFIDETDGQIEPLAKQIGAANTLVVRDDGTAQCTNTDAPAAVEALCEGMNIARDDLRGRKCAIMGAGGVARAIAVALADAGCDVIIFNRTQDKARALAGELSLLNLPGQIVPGKPGRIGCGCFPILINCTPIGMATGPAPDQSPLDVLGAHEGKALGEGVTVMDTVYAPLRTPLIEHAEAAGATVITGDAMFAKQAAMQLKAWTDSDI